MSYMPRHIRLNAYLHEMTIERHKLEKSKEKEITKTAWKIGS